MDSAREAGRSAEMRQLSVGSPNRRRAESVGLPRGVCRCTTNRAFAERQADGGELQGEKAGVRAQLQGRAAEVARGTGGRPPRGRDLPEAGCREWSWIGRVPGHQNSESAELLRGLMEKRPRL
jgi:hypothetical protein